MMHFISLLISLLSDTFSLIGATVLVTFWVLFTRDFLYPSFLNLLEKIKKCKSNKRK